MRCRHCGVELNLKLVDLGSAPPSNAYLSKNTLKTPEKWFPLRVLICEKCWLVQTDDFAAADELFNDDYAYFSGYSKSWLEHCERYVASMVSYLKLTSQCYVIEIAANDGYLLQYVKKHNIPCTGVEPTARTARAAREKGIHIIEEFFGMQLAKQFASEGRHADLVIANNVLAHVPDINDFVSGIALLLKPHGIATFEFPQLLKLMAENQFDTIYHEHFSYLSLSAVESIFVSNGLAIFDVEEHSTHGGSLRVFAQRIDAGKRVRHARVDDMLAREIQFGMRTADYYADFQSRADGVKDDFLTFLLDAKRQGQSVVAYGAAAKGNTLINYAGIRHDLIAFVVDQNRFKQGKYLPGSRIPIVEEKELVNAKPDYVVILPWNLKSEVMDKLDYVRSWGGKFITAVPKLSIF